MRELIRRCTFRPYIKGATFTLSLYDLGRYHGQGPQWALGYRLTMSLNGKRTVLFEGDDYGCAPGHAIDSDAAVEGIMSFLTLRPGDTDADYFAGYTDEQREYCEQHAEALSCEVHARFCDENGNVIERRRAS